MSTNHQRIREALQILGIRRFLLGIHDGAFPENPETDLGHGSPSSAAATAFLEWLRDLGFDGLQLGPQGVTPAGNPSPYNGTWFSRHPASIDAAALFGEKWGRLLTVERVAIEAATRPQPLDRVAHVHADIAARRLLTEATAAFRARRNRGEGRAIADLDRRLALFQAEQASWLERDALFEAWRQERPAPNILPPWPAGAPERSPLLARYQAEVESYAFVQLLLHEQHRKIRAYARQLGLVLFGDMQVGMSERDAWAARDFLLPGYLLGAPPSRTNPEGQAWNYPVLDPGSYHGGRGPAIAFLRTRLAKLLDEYDGLRIDHPHGLVCPWVYRCGPDPDQAVRAGARLFASPGLPDHPELTRWAITKPDQIDWSRPRHDDHWERELDDAQVSRYAVLFDVLMEEARVHGRHAADIACEVLSTQPLPLRKVVERHGLGRFRVTQKADLSRPDDVYRAENARPEDWILLGNHDTPTIWQRAERWVTSGAGASQAAYAAERLRIPGAVRANWERRVASTPVAIAQARFADLFVGPATHVLVSFGDLLGFREPYNVPGTVSESNWSQRVPSNYRARQRAFLVEGRALDLPAALAAALRARGGPAELAAALDRDAQGRGL